jgi:hypothetical protein
VISKVAWQFNSASVPGSCIWEGKVISTKLVEVSGTEGTIEKVKVARIEFI